MIISSFIEAFVSETRLVSFLDAEELQSDARTVISTLADGQEPRTGDELITVTNGSFKWDPRTANSTLSNINVSVKKGELVGVLGRVGDGKVSGPTLRVISQQNTDFRPRPSRPRSFLPFSAR